MSSTIEELKTKLIAQCADILETIEILHITPEDLVERFTDRVEEYYDDVSELVGDAEVMEESE